MTELAYLNSIDVPQVRADIAKEVGKIICSKRMRFADFNNPGIIERAWINRVRDMLETLDLLDRVEKIQSQLKSFRVRVPEDD